MSHPQKRTPWLDEKGETLLIDDQARKLGYFVDALADGRIDKHELEEAEKHVIDLLKEVEPKLDDSLHEQVSRLLVGVSAYCIMQTLAEMQSMADDHAIRSRKLVL
jgi:hypothetical protein